MRAPTHKTAPVWLLALITVSGTLAMHMFVPALPAASRDLGASIAQMQMTISLYILGVAAGQLVYGPLSDALGRRPMLIVGLSLYVVASVGAAFAPEVHSLIVARLLQALGGCAGLALGRAVVRDTAPPDEAVRHLALINLIMMAGPGLAPIIGSGLSAGFGWRSIFWVLAALGAVTLAFTWRRLPETSTPSGTLKVASLARDYSGLLGSRRFLGFAFGGACSTTSIYAFISAAPYFVTSELHRPLHEVGFYLAIVMVGIALGNILTRQLIRRVPMARLLISGNAISLVSSAAFLALAALGHLTVAWMLCLMFPFAMGCGMSSPAALTKSISVDPKRVGSASGLYGCAQMTVGAICTALVGVGEGAAWVAGSISLGSVVLGQFGFWVALAAERREK